MKKIALILAIFVVFALGVYFAYRNEPLNSYEYVYSGENTPSMIRVDYPKPGDVITSPLIISGEGTWQLVL